MAFENPIWIGYGWAQDISVTGAMAGDEFIVSFRLKNGVRTTLPAATVDVNGILRIRIDGDLTAKMAAGVHAWEMVLVRAGASAVFDGLPAVTAARSVTPPRVENDPLTGADAVPLALTISGSALPGVQISLAKGMKGDVGDVNPENLLARDQAVASAADAAASATSASTLAASFKIPLLQRTLVRPTLDLDFAPGVTPANLTVTRSTTGTRFNANGLIESVAANTLRHDFDPVTGEYLGVLIEEARTNLFRSSGDLRMSGEGNPNAFWGNGGAAGSVVGSISSHLAPNGVNYYTKLELASSSGAKDRRQNVGIAAGSTYCGSLFFKRGTLPTANFQLHLAGGTAAIATVNYDWATKALTVGGLAAIAHGKIDIREDEVFLWLIAKDDGDGTGAFMLVQSSAATVAGTIFTWGAQLEAGEFPTSYIPTTTASVTRVADDLSMTLGTWFNPSEGAFLVDIPRAQAGGHILNFDRGGTAYGPRLQYTLSSSKTPTLAVVDDAGTVVVSSISSGAGLGAGRSAAAYRLNDFAISNNGGTATTDTAGAVPTALTNLKIGRAVNGLIQLNGRIRRLIYFPRRLSNADLQAVTS